MRILCALTYYRPYTSGLTIYVERLATALARRGHSVTVLTSQYDPSLPTSELLEGVRVVRAPVLARVSKGVIMPTFGGIATALALTHDAMSLHLPQFDAPGLALRGRLRRQPVVLTYHSDLQLPPGMLNQVANRVVDGANLVAGQLATRIVAYTHDFAAHSPYLRRFSKKIVVIPPPVEVAPVTPDAVAAFRERWNLRGPVIGMAARLAAEKGVEVLLKALPKLLAHYPEARVLFAGPYEHVLGEAAYARRLAPEFRRFAKHWTFMGTLDAHEMAAFFHNLDVLVVPSLNSTETFGLVQVEAMLCGTPSIASALPGVRQPVHQTGMGEVVPIGDHEALAAALLRVIELRERYLRPREAIAAKFSTERTALEYEQMFQRLRDGRL
ncbi:glycosyltransferase family 4 protein [Candidatus Viridilinea mediisalina]|uniref:Glycosyl transferase family 1 n=1 Tax=Candidatus Viridilinea mediisalina TaxID=2024553 RepID=A0A2A6RDJ0_9CHLR|nr:glycosyltransferase family 4 protein [Candidatus Viridilinea mediisalina]PDW00152.1 glycosyl transferase family 1 [Candidatus Viridilinea mediisalina]